MSYLQPKQFIKSSSSLEEGKEETPNIIGTSHQILNVNNIVNIHGKNTNTENIYDGLEPPPPSIREEGEEKEGEEEEGEYCRLCSTRYTSPHHNQSALHLLRMAAHLKEKDEREEVERHDEYVIPRGNRGFQLLLKSGWEGKGLGKAQEGSKYPIKTSIKNDRLGVGVKPRCPPRVTHPSSLPERPKLQHRLLPSSSLHSPLYSDIFTALDLLRPLDEEKFLQSKKLRTLQVQRNLLKSSLLRRELYHS